MDMVLAETIRKACRAHGLIAEAGSGYPNAGPGNLSYMVAIAAPIDVILSAIIAHADMFIRDGVAIFSMMDELKVDFLEVEQHPLLHILY
jgi:hypothetical protein